MGQQISSRELYVRLQHAAARLGFDKREAKAIARNLWEAELAGHAAHGVARLALLRRQVNSGKINPVTTRPAIHDGARGSTFIDARGRTGWLALPIALRRTARRLRNLAGDIAVVTLRNAAPGIGYLGQYGRAMAARGMVLLMMVKSEGGAIPEGATAPVLGTNPLCVAVPGPDGPIVLDMSTTVVSWNAVELARLRQELLPVGVAVDVAGHCTEDPFAVSGLRIFGGYKGTGLSIMIDLLAGALGGSSPDPEQPGRWGFIAVALRAAAFRAEEGYLNSVRQTLDSLRRVLPAQEGARYPGSEAEKSLRCSLRQGWITLDAQVMRLLEETT